MRFLILGAGAIGEFFGGKLLKGGADVTFLVRATRAAQLQRDGLVVKTQDGEIRTQVRAVQKDQIENSYDVILLCCKAYDFKEAIAAISPAMGERSVVLPLLNGIRHIEVLTQTFGANRGPRRDHRDQCGSAIRWQHPAEPSSDQHECDRRAGRWMRVCPMQRDQEGSGDRGHFNRSQQQHCRHDVDEVLWLRLQCHSRIPD